MADADLKLLGNTIRAFREHAQPKKISQFRLAAMMEWEGTAPVIEIEKGRRHPRPETLNRLGEVMQLSPADIAYLHELAGYREITVMPPAVQIKRVLESFEPDVAQHLYPAYVMDYQFNFWMMNSATGAYQGGVFDPAAQAPVFTLNGLRMSFDTRLPHSDGFLNMEAMQRETLFRFKAHNLYRRHEPFYQAYPECMREQLTPEDYAGFVKRWDEVDVRMQDVFPITPQITERIGSEVFIFNVHMVEILHLDRLLFVAYYQPKDDGAGNRQRCEAFFTRNSPATKSCVRAWDFWQNGQPG